jgi:ABC-type multidrug transport system ATPase subunit
MKQQLDLHVDHLALSTRRGRVFGPLSFDAPAGSVVALHGASGTGKTAALLALTGRMRSTAGTASLGRMRVERASAQVRAACGLGVIEGVTDLDGALSPAQHVRERRIVLGRRHCAGADTVLERCGLAGVADMPVRTLAADEKLRLGVALALVGDPALIALDDLDRDLTDEQVASVGELLSEVASAGTTVLVGCLDEHSAGFATVLVALGDGRSCLVTHADQELSADAASNVEEATGHAIA